MSGIGFNGLVFVDDISMRGLIDYVQNEPLSERGHRLVTGCDSPEAKAAVLALDQGAHIILSVHDIDGMVRGVAHAYRTDRMFRSRIDEAFRAYERFAS